MIDWSYGWNFIRLKFVFMDEITHMNTINCMGKINMIDELWHHRWDSREIDNYMKLMACVATPLWRKCEVVTHTPENGTWESPETPKNSECNFRGQNTLHWCVLYIVGKVLKCRCPKWPFMSHLDMYNTSYGRKKGRESNWQFDSRPLKVGNRPDPSACRWSATHR